MIELLEMLEKAVDDVYIISYKIDAVSIKIKTIRDAEESIGVGWLKNRAGIESAKKYIEQLRGE